MDGQKSSVFYDLYRYLMTSEYDDHIYSSYIMASYILYDLLKAPVIF